jgi:hypothetical protein
MPVRITRKGPDRLLKIPISYPKGTRGGHDFIVVQTDRRDRVAGEFSVAGAPAAVLVPSARLLYLRRYGLCLFPLPNAASRHVGRSHAVVSL